MKPFSKALQAKPDAIKPGQTCAAEVEIKEKYNGKPMTVKFCFNSFIVGMYQCIYVNGQVAQQGGDHDNKKCMTSIKKDIKAAITRGAKVTIGSIRPIKTM